MAALPTRQTVSGSAPRLERMNGTSAKNIEAKLNSIMSQKNRRVPWFFRTDWPSTPTMAVNPASVAPISATVRS